MLKDSSLVARVTKIRRAITDQLGDGLAGEPILLLIDELLADIQASTKPKTKPKPAIITPLNGRQVEVYNAILKLWQTVRRTPTDEELCRAAEIHNWKSMEKHLDRFVAHGLIRRDPRPPGHHHKRPHRNIDFIRLEPIIAGEEEP